MTFDILDKMVGLSVMNAVDGSIIGTSTRLVFSKRGLDFKYVLVERNDDENRLLYLQYPDILRVNEKAILCLTDDTPSASNYIFYNDPDAFVFVGNEAVDENGKLIGTISSAQLDEAAKVISFTVRQGRSKAVFDIDRLVEVTQGGVIIVHRSPDDIFIEEPEPQKGKKKDKKAAEVVEEPKPVEEIKTAEVPQAAEVPPVPESEPQKIELNMPPVMEAVPEIPKEEISQPEPSPEAKKEPSLDIQWGDAPAYTPAQNDYDDFDEEPESKGKKKKHKAPKAEKVDDGGSSKPGNVLGGFKAMDLVSGLRYVCLVAFFAAAIILK